MVFFTRLTRDTVVYTKIKRPAGRKHIRTWHSFIHSYVFIMTSDKTQMKL